jgi:hypothetical protein
VPASNITTARKNGLITRLRLPEGVHAIS